jgi:transposase-like protein
VETADADVLREMITTFAGALMNAEVDSLCGAGYGERSPERVNSRNGYRERTWDTRTGTIDLAVKRHGDVTGIRQKPGTGQRHGCHWR